MNDSQLRSEIIQVMQASSNEESMSAIPRILGASSSKHFKLNSIFDIKSLCNKVLKVLREELAHA